MPHHVVVDGSNIATEGRSLPSLHQLNEAVMAFIEEHPDALITVVVDATFGHRIEAKEVKEFDEAVANNELVAPPAGAIGRGDAFVLSIANKVNATILTNDSFQEFHGQYDWLFEEGRLIGGKPVPHIGWVFVPRIPVRGAISRSAMKDAKRRRGPAGAPKVPTMRVGSPEASMPMPVPKAPPPGARVAGSDKATSAAVMAEAIADATRAGDPAVAAVEPARSGRRRGGRGKGSGAAAAAAVAVAATPTDTSAPSSAVPTATQTVNDLLPFLGFVEHHPLGSSVNAIVENYSSHGAYVRVGDVKGYVPLRLMADPAPRSAREFMKIGDAITLVVDSFAPARRSIDLAVAGMSTAHPVVEPARRGRKSRPVAGEAVEAVEAVAATAAEAPAEVAPAPKGRGRKKAAAPVAVPVEPAAVEAAPAKPSRRRGAKAAPAVVELSPAVEPAPEPVPAAPVKAPARAKRVAKSTRAVEKATPAAPAKAATPARAKRVAKSAPAVEIATPVAEAPAAPVAPAKAKAPARAKRVAKSTPAVAKATPAAPAKAKRAAKAAPAPAPVVADEAPATPVRRRRIH